MKKFLILFGFLVLATSGFVAFKMLQPPPDDLDLRATRTSEKGLYVVTFAPERGIPAVGPITVWQATVKTTDQTPVTGAKITIDGGMPQHGHGLPTSPASTGEISPGVYAIDGVKFSMRGWWEFRLDISAEAGNDTVVFNRVLE